MKKLLGISLVAVLAVSPLMAKAAAVAGEPSHIGDNVQATAVTASVEPEFALAEANTQTDGNAASAGYVKGAYNAAIKAINKVNAKAAAAATAAQSAAEETAAAAIAGLDSEVTQTAGDNTLAVSITQTDGELASVSATISAGTVTKTALKSDVQTSLGKADTALQSADIASSLADDSTNAKAAGAKATYDAIAAAQSAAEDYADGLAGNYDAAGAAAGAETAAKSYADGLVADKATKTGVDNTIKAVTLTQGAVSQGLSGDLTRTTGNLIVMTDWTDETSTGQSTKTFLTGVTTEGLNTNVSVAAPTINPASVSYENHSAGI